MVVAVMFGAPGASACIRRVATEMEAASEEEKVESS